MLLQQDRLWKKIQIEFQVGSIIYYLFFIYSIPIEPNQISKALNTNINDCNILSSKFVLIKEKFPHLLTYFHS